MGNLLGRSGGHDVKQHSKGLRTGPGLLAPMGYNGRGIAPGTVFGRTVARHIAGKIDGDLPVPIAEFVPERFRTIRQFSWELTFKSYRLWNSL